MKVVPTEDGVTLSGGTISTVTTRTLPELLSWYSSRVVCDDVGVPLQVVDLGTSTVGETFSLTRPLWGVGVAVASQVVQTHTYSRFRSITQTYSLRLLLQPFRARCTTCG